MPCFGRINILKLRSHQLDVGCRFCNNSQKYLGNSYLHADSQSSDSSRDHNLYSHCNPLPPMRTVLFGNFLPS